MLIPNAPENMPRSHHKFWGFVGRIVLQLLGWKYEGELPNFKKAVVIVAPHTSNWDFVLGMAAKMTVGLKANWLGKDAIFVGPAAILFTSWGGIPVERMDPHDLVAQVASEFDQREKMWLGLSPEGTRKHVDNWKTGFWHIAKTADVPIQTVAFDYTRRTLIIGKAFIPSDDKLADIASIRQYFSEVGHGKFPKDE